MYVKKYCIIPQQMTLRIGQSNFTIILYENSICTFKRNMLKNMVLFLNRWIWELANQTSPSSHRAVQTHLMIPTADEWYCGWKEFCLWQKLPYLSLCVEGWNSFVLLYLFNLLMLFRIQIPPPPVQIQILNIKHDTLLTRKTTAIMKNM